MKSLHRLLIVALAALPLAALAQPAPKVFTVDIAKAFEAHPQTKVQQAALKADEQKANEQLKKMEGDARALAGKLRDQQTKFDDPTDCGQPEGGDPHRRAEDRAGTAGQADTRRSS